MFCHTLDGAETDELRAWLRLSLTEGVGNETARQLLAAFGSPQAIFAQDAAALKAVGNERLRRAIEAEPDELSALLARTLAWLAEGSDRCILTLGDTGYPPTLLNINDPPLMLYLLGSLVAAGEAKVQFSTLPCLAIVGSRNPTPQGHINAGQFAEAFGAAGWCVVSGLALGVDGAAHQGALRAGAYTVAVVGTGLDRVYPRKHLELAHRIARRGLIISEFALGTPPLTGNFPRRNRLISGLSQGTLVIEAALQSGSLITARLAADQGKEVFAIPGSIHSQQSRGCHLLIKQGAKLVESAQDVLEELQPAGTRPLDLADDSQPQPSPRPDDPLLRAMGFDACSLDALQARTGLATADLQAQLLALELQGELARLPGGQFVRLAQS